MVDNQAVDWRGEVEGVVGSFPQGLVRQEAAKQVDILKEQWEGEVAGGGLWAANTVWLLY